MEINQKCYFTSFKPIPQWSIKKANWEKCQTACNEYITEPNKSNNSEDAYNMYINQLTNAIDSSIPKTTFHKTTKSTENPEKTWHPDDLIKYKRASAIARKTIKTAKKEDWNNFCSTLNHQTPSKKSGIKLNASIKLTPDLTYPYLKRKTKSTLQTKKKLIY